MRRKFMPRAGRIFKNSSATARCKQDAQPCFYLYRQIMGSAFADRPGRGRELRGISARRHQETRAHARGQGGRPRAAHRNLECADRPGVSDLPRRPQHWMNSSPKKFPASRRLISRPRTACGTRRGRFTIADEIKFIETQFARIPFLYIADGHHRSAAAARVFQCAPGRRAERTISRRDFSAQPDADSALQPRVEGFERLDAGAIAGNARQQFLPSNPTARPRPRANTNSAFICKANGTRLRSSRQVLDDATTRLNSST